MTGRFTPHPDVCARIRDVRDASTLAPHSRARFRTELATDDMSFVTASARAHVSVVAKATTAKKTATTKVTAPKAKIASAIDRVKLPALTLAAQAAALVPAAHAEAGKLFDFDLTLPIIATEFLILMTILDKTVFGPVGKALDDRDELIRSQLAAVGDNSAEVDGLIVRRARNILCARDRDVARGRGRAREGIDPLGRATRHPSFWGLSARDVDGSPRWRERSRGD